MLPWQISALDLDEKETMESLGLLKAYLTLDMSSPDSGSHFLLFPSGLDATEDEGSNVWTNQHQHLHPLVVASLIHRLVHHP
jgi:hypothetical protein